MLLVQLDDGWENLFVFTSFSFRLLMYCIVHHFGQNGVTINNMNCTNMSIGTQTPIGKQAECALLKHIQSEERHVIYTAWWDNFLLQLLQRHRAQRCGCIKDTHSAPATQWLVFRTQAAHVWPLTSSHWCQYKMFTPKLL